MDQAASAYQAVSGHQRECGENANLVRRGLFLLYQPALNVVFVLGVAGGIKELGVSSKTSSKCYYSYACINLAIDTIGNRL
jgi:hypothetical protein